MNKVLFCGLLAAAMLMFAGCIVLPDTKGGYYSYPIGGDEIEYTNPDGSKTKITQDGTVTRKP